MRLSDLQRKDIVDINTGKRIGRIIDVEINEDTGEMTGLIIERKYMRSLFNSEEDSKVKYEQIKTIGEDVILVDMS